MRRPSRLFTVEVKRSRSRGGEATTADIKVKRDQKFSASISGQLSWGDLLSRAAEEIDAALVLPGAEVSSRDDQHAARAAAQVTKVLTGRSSQVSDPSGTPRSRVLPSLLPPETPTPEQTDNLPDDSSAVVEAPPPAPRQRQRSAEAPAAKPARVATADQPVRRNDVAADAVTPSVSSLDADRIREMVEQHLRQLPGTRDDLAVQREERIRLEETPVGNLPQPKRRRQDFWKRRLRSRVARD